MLLKQLDMPSARYAFALLAKGEICQKREGFISHRIGAKRQYIEFEQSENRSSGRSSHIDRKKNKSKNKRRKSFYSCSFCYYKGLGLAYLHLTGQMRCSHLTAFFKFSAKNITHYRGGFLIKNYLLKKDTEYISPLPTETVSLPEDISISLER